MVLFSIYMAAIEKGKNIQSALRQSRVQALRQPPSEAPAEEAGNEDFSGADSISGPDAQKKAGALLRAKRMVGKTVKKVATKAVIETGKMASQAQNAAAALARTSGSSLISIGMGFGITLVGLVIGVPLILLGLILFIAGILGMITAKATMIAAKAAESAAKVQAKAAEAKEAGGGGGLGGAAITETVKNSLRLILAPFEIIGCTMAGFLGGLIILVILVIGAASLIPGVGDIFGAISDLF